MTFNAIMHVTFFTHQMEEMRRFYTEVLGGEVKIVTRAYLYKDHSKKRYADIAETDPNRIIIMYIEIAPGQFVELFPAEESQLPHPAWNSEAGYSHFALTVDDIHATRAELEARGLAFDTEISKGPSETYQMWAHDPDGNKFEVMQYTEKSFQLVGNIMHETPEQE